MSRVMEQVLALPTLPEFVEELNARLATERQRRTEFYAELPDGKKWEFINGEIVMHSPDTVRHILVRQFAFNLLNAFADVRALGLVLSEKALCVFPRNDFMPDVAFFQPAKASKLKPDQLKLPPPDLVVEVLSRGTEKQDRQAKFCDYEAHGVAEYWILDPVKEVLEQYVLHTGKYQLEMKSSTGEIRSRTIRGFRAPVRALFDAGENRKALRQILGTSPAD